jgi:hypothetical protein
MMMNSAQFRADRVWGGRGHRAAGHVVFLLALHASPLMSADNQAHTVILVEDGQPRSVLVVTEEAFHYEAQPERGKRSRETTPAAAYERLAAEELGEHVRRISGVSLEVIPQGAPLSDRVPVFIGSAADPGLIREFDEQDSDPGSFALVIEPDRVSIRGLSQSGTLNGVYELLEQIGVRWYMPGELGLVTPRTTIVRIRQQRTLQKPSFPARHLQGVRAPDWERRMRLGGPYFPAAHGIPGFGHRASDQLFQEHPEYFSLIDGERKPRQLCVSNPQVLRLAVEATKDYFRSRPEADMMGIGANDGRGFCECDNCRALDGGDYDPFGHFPSMTDRYVWFFNGVLEGVEAEFPNKRLGFYAYSVYNRPPVKVTPDPRLVPAIALITLCRLHGMSNPVCPEKSYEERIIREWGKLVPEVYYRGYWFNLADPGLPFFMIDRIRREIPLGKELGIAGWRVESPYDWAASVPSRYIACKLMWDHTADVDRLLSDFYEKFFGPAAEPMREYVEVMSQALHTADYHTGSSWDMPYIYTSAVRGKARAALERSLHLAPQAPYASRIRMYSRSLDYLDSFDLMLKSRADHDFTTSKEALARMEATREELRANDPPLIGRAAESYLRRFFSRPTLEGHERTTGGNRLVAGLDDLWQFQIDPERIGEDIGWWRPECAGGNWQTIKTSTQSWSSQGLRYYKGLAWYRQTVEISDRHRGKRVFLWVGGIDELAKVWVNGRLLGISPRASFTPFEMDATDAIHAGGPNMVVICINNTTLNELGTGGITGPVMFYAPAAGRDAEIRNAKPPHSVFPEY